MDELRLEVAPSIHLVPEADWDATVGEHNPFVEHRFLRVLEEAGCLGPKSGWIPQYLIARRGENGPVHGIAPLFARTDSYGEYIFDWAWANGAMRAGIDYYPKLTAAVPFTPATGPRLMVHPDADAEAIRDALAGGALVLAERMKASGVHWLFCTEADARALATRRYSHRHTFQFHWINAGYGCFEDFLTHLERRRRKEVRRERKKAASHGLRIVLKTGAEMTRVDWSGLWSFYRATHASRPWQQRYLNQRWFELARTDLADRTVAVMAYDGDRPVGGSLSFRKGQHLYGRYWGAVADVDALHFECCYYRLVEYAIDEGITLFEAGAQGAHKLRRGFLPTVTHSAHYLVHPGLRQAVDQFIRQERASVAAELDTLGAHSPFSESEPGEPVPRGAPR